MDNYFTKLNSINLNDVKEQKNKLDYISWAWAWGRVKELYPNTTATVYENPSVGLPYFTDGRTCMVKVGVTIEGIEHIEWLPVMDYKNASIPVEKVTTMDINKAIQRCTVKAIARHGLGLYVYAGEDLPENPDEEPQPVKKAEPKAVPEKTSQPVLPPQELPSSKIQMVNLLEGIGVDIDKVLLAYKHEKFEDISLQELQQAYLRKVNSLNKGGAR